MLKTSPTRSFSGNGKVRAYLCSLSLGALVVAGSATGQEAAKFPGFVKVFTEDFDAVPNGSFPSSLTAGIRSGTITVVDGALRADLVPNGIVNPRGSGAAAYTEIPELGGPVDTAKDFILTGSFEAVEQEVDSAGNRAHFVAVSFLSEEHDRWTPLEGHVIAMRYAGTGDVNNPGEILVGAGDGVGSGGDTSIGVFTGDISVGSTVCYTIRGSYNGTGGLDVAIDLSCGSDGETFSHTFETAAVGNQFGVYSRQTTTSGIHTVDFDDICIFAEGESIDTDEDGLSDEEEEALGTDPINPDTDGDGLTDGNEVSIETDPLNPDTDADCVNDGDELDQGSNPLDPDTDNDGIKDGDDPTPTEPGVPDDFIEQALCNLAHEVICLPLSEFKGSRCGHGWWNWWAQYIHRHHLAAQIYWACKMVRCGHFEYAQIKVCRAIKRVDGNAFPRDWMVDGAARLEVKAELETIKSLLDLLE